MKFHIKSSGGIGDIQLEGTVDAVDLPSSLVSSLSTLLNAQFDYPAETSSNFRDGMCFDISVSDCERPFQVQVEQASASPELWTACSTLFREVARQKKSG
jgi:hypothetical protein